MGQLIQQFGIDWRLLAAQAVNFGALFFILYRFAYRPILAMLDQRRAGISEGVRIREEAERKLRAAGEEREAMLKATEKESVALIAKAEEAGKARGAQMLGEAEKRKEDMMAEAKRRAEQEKRLLEEQFSREAEEMVRMAVARMAAKNPAAIDANLVKLAMAEIRTSKSSL